MRLKCLDDFVQQFDIPRRIRDHCCEKKIVDLVLKIVQINCCWMVAMFNLWLQKMTEVRNKRNMIVLRIGKNENEIINLFMFACMQTTTAIYFYMAHNSEQFVRLIRHHSQCQPTTAPTTQNKRNRMTTWWNLMNGIF